MIVPFMIAELTRWLDRRREIRRRWQSDARMLVADQPRTAYYEAQRRAAAARTGGDASGFWHWSKTAAEIARICPTAEMDLETLKSVVDRELGKR
ncbi:MAG: hypothetical protein AB7P20_10870 [Rhizobiaceae bacterium]